MADSPADKPLPTGLELTGIDPVFRENPHAVLDRLRAKAPAYHDPTLDLVYLTRHADARAMLADKTLSRDPRKAPPGSLVRLRAPPRVMSGDLPANIMWMDDPEHRRQRSLIAKAFSLRAIEAMRTPIHDIVNDLLNAAEAKGEFDGVADFAVPLPISTLALMLGLPSADWPQFYSWSMGISLSLNAFRTQEEAERLQASETGLEGYMRRMIAERRARPTSDILSGLVHVEDNGERLSDGEIVSIASIIVVAGNVTTTDLIGNSIVTLLKHPEDLARLRVDPSLIKSAIEELLRFNPPVAVTTRHPMAPGTYLGCPVKAGTGLVASLLGANRDPGVYPDPHTLKLDRNPKDHMAFGGGIHHCIGAPLARLETEIALLSLFTRFPRLRLKVADPVKKAAPTLCGYEAIPLAI